MSLPFLDHIPFPLFLAPMAGVTDPVFRSLCKQLGADVMVTEFVSADGVVQCWERNKRYTEFSDDHRPIGIQIFGANPAHMAEASRIIVNELNPDFIDINYGCPVPKVVGKNGGSSLLRDLPLLALTAKHVVQAVGDQLPVTAKIRIGWDEHSICAKEVCHLLEAEGISMITIHGRTRAQQYGGVANWDLINECAQSINVPVIGNGDIRSALDIERIKTSTSVRGVMIGRAAMENPWIFAQAKHYLSSGVHLPPPSPQQKWEFIINHARLALESGRYGDEAHTMKFMRTRLVAYSKGFPGAKELRSKIVKITSIAMLEDLAQATISSLDASTK